MAKRYFLIALLFATIINACGPGYEEPDTAIEAGRQFIAALYNGNFKRAGQLIVSSPENESMLHDTLEKDFRSRNGFQKDALSKASIQIDRIVTVDSATTLIEFTHAYYGKPSALEVKKTDGFWRINLKKR